MRLSKCAHSILSLVPCLLLTTSFGFADTTNDSAALSARSQAVKERIDGQFSELHDLYVFLHKHPELSLQENATSAKLAETMKTLGFEVTTGFGGNGIECVYRNGDGPTIMVRTDMDALPVIERTGR